MWSRGIVVLVMFCLATGLKSDPQVRLSSPSFLQDQQFLTLLSWQSNLRTMLFGPMNQVLSGVFRTLYGDDEASSLLGQLQTCEAFRVNELLVDSVRITALVFEFTTICSSPDPISRASSVFSQVLDFFMRVVRPCDLDRDVVADLAIVQMLVFTQRTGSAEYTNVTAQVATYSRIALANYFEALGNYTNYLATLTNDTNSGITDLVQNTYNSLVGLMNQVYAQSQTDLNGAITLGQTRLMTILDAPLQGLQAYGVSPSDIDSFRTTLNDITRELTSTLAQITTGDRDQGDAERQLGSFSSDQVDLIRESFQIINDLTAQRADDICASLEQAVN